MSVACNSQYLFLAQITWRWQVGGDWVLLCFVCLLVLGPGLNGQETCGRRPGHTMHLHLKPHQWSEATSPAGDIGRAGIYKPLGRRNKQS